MPLSYSLTGSYEHITTIYTINRRTKTKANRIKEEICEKIIQDSYNRGKQSMGLVFGNCPVPAVEVSITKKSK